MTGRRTSQSPFPDMQPDDAGAEAARDLASRPDAVLAGAKILAGKAATALRTTRSGGQGKGRSFQSFNYLFCWLH